VPKKIFLAAALFWTGIILFFCLENSENIPSANIPYIDKVVHAVFHFVFTTLWFLYLKKKLNGANTFKPLVLAFVFSFIFGISIEIMQELFTTTRSADFFDVMSNVFGSTLSVILIILLKTYDRIIDKI
jgi:VanZ family protein